MGRQRLDTMGAVAAVVVVTVVGIAAATASARSAPAAARSCSEPWSVCSPDARWLRDVLALAGYRHDVGANGAALVVAYRRNGQGLERFFWTTDGTRIASPYRPIWRSGGVTVYGDGTRIVWRVQGLCLWVEPAPARMVLARLIAASKTIARR